MAGSKIYASERNATMTAVDNARAKWGLGKKNSNVSEGTIATASDYNNLVSWLTEAKNKAGATTGIEGNVTPGSIMYQNKLNNLTSQANAVYNYCKCHGNCSGSCTGSCTGSCSGGCSGSCRTSCEGSCGSRCRGSSGSCSCGSGGGETGR